MKYMIGVDVGGTKAESVLFDETGHILTQNVSRGFNALDMGEKGIQIAEEMLYDVVMKLYAKLPAGAELEAVYSGMAGSVDWYPGVLDRELVPRLPGKKVRLEGDGGSLIAAVQGHSDGCSLIAGTGSALYIRCGEELKLFGGYGYLIDTQGSGYTLGRDAFLAAFRSRDGRGPKSVLYDLIREQMGSEPVESVPKIYQGGRAYIASFARTVFEGRRLGDEMSCRIFDHGVNCLAELVQLGERELQRKDFSVVTGGGLFSAFPEYMEALKQKISPETRLVPMDVPPILGAAVEALWDSGAADTPEFRQRFMRDYRLLTAVN